MDNYQNQKYLEPNEYLHKFKVQLELSAIIFEEFICKNQELKNKIIMNFLAREVMTSKSIFTLWKEEDFSNCQVLLRVLLERYLFLIHLSEKNLFDDFNDKTFIEEYELVHNQGCDEFFNNRFKPNYYSQLKGNTRKRYEELKKSKFKWNKFNYEKNSKKWT